MKIKASFMPSAQDALDGYRMHFKRKGSPYKSYILLTVILSAVLSGLAFWFDIPPLYFIGIFVGGIMFIQEWNIERMIRKNFGKRKPTHIEIEIDDINIKIDAPDSSLSHKLNLITKASFDARGALLYTETDNYFFIPSRAFTAAEDVSALHEFLSHKIRNTA